MRHGSHEGIFPLRLYAGTAVSELIRMDLLFSLG